MITTTPSYSPRSMPNSNDGYRRLLLTLEADVRPEVEEEFADRRKAANCFRRWFLDREVEREITRRIEERSRLISVEGL